MVRIQFSIGLQYEVGFPGADFIFNIQASRTRQQTVIAEQLTLSQSLPTLAHTDATVRAFRQRAEVNKHFGGRTEMIDRQQIRELVPTLNMDPGHLPVLAGLWHMDGATARHWRP